jgi:hypothetical protein
MDIWIAKWQYHKLFSCWVAHKYPIIDGLNGNQTITMRGKNLVLPSVSCGHAFSIINSIFS